MIREINDIAIRIWILYDESEGEITPEIEELSKQLEQDEADMCDNIGSLIANIDAENEGLKKEIERLSKRMKSNAKRADFFKKLVLEHIRIAGGNNIKGKFFKTSVRCSKSVDFDAFTWEKITNDAILEAAKLNEKYPYVRFKAEINKTLVKEDLDAGVEIEGAAIVENESIRFI